MAIPKWHEFFPAIMHCLSDGKEHHRNEIKAYSVDFCNLTDEEKNKMTKSGAKKAENRVCWAVSALKDTRLIQRTHSGYYKITALGMEILKKCPENLNYKFLHQYGDFKFFAENYKKGNLQGIAAAQTEKDTDLEVCSENDSINKMEKAFEDLNKKLREEILQHIMHVSDYDFEDLVTKLLIKMGYGPLDFNKNAVTKRSYDGGIDSVVTADRFGFEFICIQAKKWDVNSTVGRPEIQRFLGALVGKSAKKGLFVTTAQFSRDAINFAASQPSAKIVLVDGTALANLMIEYGFGVSTVETFEVKRVDKDFFNECLWKNI